MQVGAALAANTQMSSLTAIATIALLNSPKLQSLLHLNSERLAKSYRTVTAFLDKHNIEYMPVSHGPFVFARVAQGAQSWEEEARAIACLKEAGVVLSPGKAYHIIGGEKGWARITFAVRTEVLQTALQRMEVGFNALRSSVQA